MVNGEFDKYYVATEPGCRERAIGWATAIADMHRADVVKDVVKETVLSAIDRRGGRRFGEWYFEK